MLLFFAFFSGVLSVLALCVLPVLPVLLWGGLSKKNTASPYIVLGSALFFIFVFTFLLKVSTLFLNIDAQVWNWVSAIIIVMYGLILLFPEIWDQFKSFFSFKQSKTLHNTKEEKSWFWVEVLLGASLGPIFASCSPTYALIISTILPQNLLMGTISILAYILGFWAVLLVIIYFGQEAIKKLRRYANPNGIFKKLIAVLLIITGILIVSGGFKWIETQLVQSGFWSTLTRIEQNALKNNFKY